MSEMSLQEYYDSQCDIIRKRSEQRIATRERFFVRRLRKVYFDNYRKSPEYKIEKKRRDKLRRYKSPQYFERAREKYYDKICRLWAIKAAMAIIKARTMRSDQSPLVTGTNLVSG